MPTRYGHFYASKPRGANREREGLPRAIRMPPSARVALLLGALGTLFGCASPMPPQPPGIPPPAAKAAPGGQVKSAHSKTAASRASALAGLAAPEGLTAIPVRQRSGAAEVDLSWAISDAANLAGYNVYRSGQPGERGARLNPHVLAVPAYRDTTVSPGVTYYYSVTAVDATGNQSAPSAPVTVSIPAAGQGSP